MAEDCEGQDCCMFFGSGIERAFSGVLGSFVCSIFCTRVGPGLSTKRARFSEDEFEPVTENKRGRACFDSLDSN